MTSDLATAGSSYGVYLTLPSQYLLAFNPLTNPPALNPPESDRTFARPFNISAEVYSSLVHVAWPVTIAALYAATVTYLNTVNKERKYAPWAISRTSGFYLFVILHNVALTLFSGWVFTGMINAVRTSWPGWRGEYGLAGAADALCKLNGPRGLGSAATYSTDSGIWSFTDQTMKLLEGQPDSTDVGRIWNEGLAFYGFIFYLSKFYEVVDTAIILAKGKSSSHLQTFHHAGAMLCMWAGIRYMSPPIWMFTFINSGIHTMMYAYYTLSALTIRVPPVMKRILTSLQIIQILFGASYAILHVFIAYDIPVTRPVVVVHNLSTVLPSATSAVASAASSLATSANIEAWLKKLALRAAGEEGLAENVRNSKGQTFGVDAIHAADAEKAQEEIRHRLSIERVNCLDTSGQVFAILLNVVYLAPLAYLFINFFVKTYMTGVKSKPAKSTKQEQIKESAKHAAVETQEKIQQTAQDPQGGATEPTPEVKTKIKEVKQQLYSNGSVDVKYEVRKFLDRMGASDGASLDDTEKELEPLQEPEKSSTPPEETSKGVNGSDSGGEENTENDMQAVKPELKEEEKDHEAVSGERKEDPDMAVQSIENGIEVLEEREEREEDMAGSVPEHVKREELEEKEDVEENEKQYVEAIREATESPMEKKRAKAEMGSETHG